MYEIRLHGLGGEGVVTLSEMIGKTATRCGRWAHSFPFFGTEVRGAPVKAFTRVSDMPIQIKSYIYTPDMIVITNDTLLADPEVTGGLKKNGVLLVNTSRTAAETDGPPPAGMRAVNATAMARELFGRPIVNTLLFGALIACSDLLPLEAAQETVMEEFAGKRPELNAQALLKGYESMGKGTP